MTTPPSTINFQNDMSGLVSAFRFHAGHPATALDRAEVEHALAHEPTASGDGSFLWLHFNLSHAGCLRWLEAHAELPDTFIEMLGEDTHSTRIERQESALVAVFNDVIFDFELTPAQISTLWLYADRGLVITLRRKPLRSIDKLRESVRGGETFRSPAELLSHLMRDQADLLTQTVRTASRDVDRTEYRFLAQRVSGEYQDLAATRRVLVRLQRMLAPEPGSVFRLLARPPLWLGSEDVQDLRESTEEFSVVLGDMAGLVERIKILQEEISARVDEQSNRTLFTLTLVTVLALPINIVAGLFGMNVGGIPLAENHHGFWLMLGLVVTFTCVTALWAFRGRPRR